MRAISAAYLSGLKSKSWTLIEVIECYLEASLCLKMAGAVNTAGVNNQTEEGCLPGSAAF